MPAPMLAFSTSPITEANPGELVFLPDPAPFSLRGRAPALASRASSTGRPRDDVPLPRPTHWSRARYDLLLRDRRRRRRHGFGFFQTAPSGRAAFRFTAFGDQGVNAPTLPVHDGGRREPGRRRGCPTVPPDGRRPRLRRRKQPAAGLGDVGDDGLGRREELPLDAGDGQPRGRERGDERHRGTAGLKRLGPSLQRPLRQWQLLLTLPAARQRCRQLGR